MNYHKLLSKQITKHLPAETLENVRITKFLEVISESYRALDRDRELAERAFTISEEEYLQLHHKLKHELYVKKQSIEKLKSVATIISGGESQDTSDDLLSITDLLNQQVSKRRNAEEVFNSLIANMQSGVLLEDENRKIVFTNQVFCNLFTIPVAPELLQGVDCSNTAEQTKDLFKNSDAFVQRIDTILTDKKLVTDELLELVDGRIFQRDYIPIYLDNRYKGHLWSYTNITERKKNEAELERLSLVASTNKNGVVFVHPDGKIFWSNEGFSAMTLYNDTEIIGKTPIELCRGPLSDRASLKTMVDAFEKGDPFDIEGIHYRKDKSWFWARTSGQPVRNQSGEISHYFSMVDDISTEKEAQLKLKQYEEQLKMALTNVGDNYWEHNFNTGKTYFSNPGNNVLGYKLDKLENIANLWWSHVHPDDLTILEKYDEQYKIGLINQHHHEYRIIHNDGTVRWVLDRGVVVEKDANEKPVKIIGTHIDITRQKQQELDLTRAKEVAEESNRLKELFLKNLSQEISLPMSTITGVTEQLMNTSMSSEQQIYLNTLQSAANNLLTTINTILNLSNSGQQE